MIKLENSTDSFFLCCSADWYTIVKAKCVDTASKKALEFIIKELGENAQVSPCMRVKKIEEKMEDSDILIRIDKIFAEWACIKNPDQCQKLLKI